VRPSTTRPPNPSVNSPNGSRPNPRRPLGAPADQRRNPGSAAIPPIRQVSILQAQVDPAQRPIASYVHNVKPSLSPTTGGPTFIFPRQRKLNAGPSTSWVDPRQHTIHYLVRLRRGRPIYESFASSREHGLKSNLPTAAMYDVAVSTESPCIRPTAATQATTPSDACQEPGFYQSHQRDCFVHHGRDRLLVPAVDPKIPNTHRPKCETAQKDGSDPFRIAYRRAPSPSSPHRKKGDPGTAAGTGTLPLLSPRPLEPRALYFGAPEASIAPTIAAKAGMSLGRPLPAPALDRKQSFPLMGKNLAPSTRSRRTSSTAFF